VALFSRDACVQQEREEPSVVFDSHSPNRYERGADVSFAANSGVPTVLDDGDIFLAGHSEASSLSIEFSGPLPPLVDVQNGRQLAVEDADTPLDHVSTHHQNAAQLDSHPIVIIRSTTRTPRIIEDRVGSTDFHVEAGRELVTPTSQYCPKKFLGVMVNNTNNTIQTTNWQSQFPYLKRRTLIFSSIKHVYFALIWIIVFLVFFSCNKKC
jgi:hypothetical protein